MWERNVPSHGRILTVSLAMMLASGLTTHIVRPAQAQQRAPESQSSPYYDVAAERRLLDLANREQIKAGLLPCKKMMD